MLRRIFNIIINSEQDTWFQINSIKNMSINFPNNIFFCIKHLPEKNNDVLIVFMDTNNLIVYTAIYYSKI